MLQSLPGIFGKKVGIGRVASEGDQGRDSERRDVGNTDAGDRSPYQTGVWGGGW